MSKEKDKVHQIALSGEKGSHGEEILKAPTQGPWDGRMTGGINLDGLFDKCENDLMQRASVKHVAEV
jgi:hypothetical protein